MQSTTYLKKKKEKKINLFLVYLLVVRKQNRDYFVKTEPGKPLQVESYFSCGNSTRLPSGSWGPL